ncbi:bifunctional (p)ppGpp synthetase/guanosine-3',5'-bis(diphosphate) 3'-pyrophosphohydrolase [Methylothermus subterraneus]
MAFELLEYAPRSVKPTFSLQQSLGCGYPPQEKEALGRALAHTLAADPKRRSLALAVAQALKEIWADAFTLQAALLADTGLERALLAEDFGPRVAEWVEKIHRLEQLACPEERLDQPRQAEMWRRLLLALANDVRPLLIVLARRLETLRLALGEHDPNTRLFARETLSIHAPLASRLGVHRLKWELEDLAFSILEPETYRQLALQLAASRASREEYVRDFIAKLKSLLERAGIAANIQGRPKHLYSIWKKMQRKHVGFSGLYDLNAVRAIVADIPTCYRVLALVHEHWEPILEEYDDYIARPKDNGYQSLHTVIQGPKGLPVEIQIRTEAMHALAEYGVAAHWRYKEGGRRDPVLEHTIAALRRSLKTGEGGDWFAGRVFVLTPRQEVLCLPEGATPVDFAYAIHTEVGHRCRGARVDGRIVPLDYRLKTGEQVEILTAKEGGPNRGWLEWVRTDPARHRIRQWFKQKEAETLCRVGRARLERELRRLGLKAIGWPELLQRFRLNRPEELWQALGRGEITRAQLTTALRFLGASTAVQTARPKSQESAQARTSLSLQVQGVCRLLTQLARCCRPAPGEEVIGYLTVHHRITIHRRDCPNVVHLPEARRRRLVEVGWES